ncbi:diaminopropionate ammonia-lyase [Fredinandcohnia onubensis]|uniref:diaminopropionate ammonia-lyase n=1 Tax=Fredinandcohnia onubensis TaxID=1571209 RepID=UPI000C0BDDC2|nr:diaminopropionate ammonia-lyase [Fredinandcohnia onubensis]
MANLTDLKTEIQYFLNDNTRKTDSEKASAAFMNREVVEKVRNFHKSFPEYKVTPLHSLAELSKQFGVRNIWVKDESYRFGLNAFKVLGGSYAVGKYLAERLNVDISELSFEQLRSKDVKEKLGDITFVTATDGNHGRGIAWAANQLGQKSVVYMPKGSSEIRLTNIRKEGAEASITDLNYDDTVRLASQRAKENGWVLVQDTAWDGYEEIPAWIMQGYLTIIDEALEQITEVDDRPTHVFLQAGVGSFAGSMLGYLVEKFGEERPMTIIVEPDKADCLYQSMRVGDGKPHAVTGALDTIMAGLACGEPSKTSWDILKDYAQVFVSCPDYAASRGMRILANPLGFDPRIVSGESGAAVGIGLVSLVVENSRLIDLKNALNLNQDSKILIISTEGDTDPDNYRKVVWDGAYPSV